MHIQPTQDVSRRTVRRSGSWLSIPVVLLLFLISVAGSSCTSESESELAGEDDLAGAKKALSRYASALEEGDRDQVEGMLCPTVYPDVVMRTYDELGALRKDLAVDYKEAITRGPVRVTPTFFVFEAKLDDSNESRIALGVRKQESGRWCIEERY